MGMRYLFTVIRLFLQLSWFSFYATARLFLFMSFSDALLFQSLPAPLNVIARLDRAICLRLRLSRFRILRSSRSMTTTKAITFLFVSFPNIFPFQSLPDLIGQFNSLSSGICGFSPCHLRLFSLSSVVSPAGRGMTGASAIKKSPECPGILFKTNSSIFPEKYFCRGSYGSSGFR